MSPKISVIIPVYNAEKYLKQCLESVQNQTFTDIEILATDNNSADSSASIIQQFANKDSRFHYLHKIGGRAGGARNEGIKHAAGKYITFLDADDFLAPDTLEKLYNTAEHTQAGIVSCGYYLTDTQGNVKNTRNIGKQFILQEKTDGITALLRAGGKIGMPYAKLIRKDILDKHNLLFPENLPSEDVAFICTCFILCGTYVHLPEPLYYYRYVPASLSNTTQHQAPKSLFITFAQMRTVLKNLHIYDTLAEEWEFRLLNMLIGGEKGGNGALKHLPKKEMKELFSICRDFYLSLPADLFAHKSRIFNLKFKIFRTALKHNWYALPKIARPFINILAAVSF